MSSFVVFCSAYSLSQNIPLSAESFCLVSLYHLLLNLLYVSFYLISGQIPVVQLNFAAMSFESPYDRDTVENCVREILNAVQRAVGAKKNVELTFSGIGRLSIRDSRVKMKFYKDFINQMDGSGKLLDSMQNVSRSFLFFLLPSHRYMKSFIASRKRYCKNVYIVLRTLTSFLELMKCLLRKRTQNL